MKLRNATEAEKKKVYIFLRAEMDKLAKISPEYNALLQKAQEHNIGAGTYQSFKKSTHIAVAAIKRGYAIISVFNVACPDKNSPELVVSSQGRLEIKGGKINFIDPGTNVTNAANAATSKKEPMLIPFALNEIPKA